MILLKNQLVLLLVFPVCGSVIFSSMVGEFLQTQSE